MLQIQSKDTKDKQGKGYEKRYKIVNGVEGKQGKWVNR